jgi:preprotein translocase subunit YajC
MINPVERSLSAGDEITVTGLYAVVVSDNGDSLTLDLGTDKVRVTMLKEHLKYEDR